MIDDLCYLARRYTVRTEIQNRTSGTSGELVSLHAIVTAEHADTRVTGHCYVTGGKMKYEELCAEAFTSALARARRQIEALEAL